MQIHKDGDTVKIFSRRLDEITYQYPDVVENIKANVKAKTAIMEGEAVAVKGEKLQKFQTLMQRKRKYDIERYIKKIPVRLFLFDLLYVDGKTIMGESYPARRKRLEDIVKEHDSITFAKRIITSDLGEVKKFFEKGLERGTEGIMAKSLADNAVYRAGAREWLWIKWKKDYLEGMVDTFDLVLIGAIYGTGKRAGKYGTLLAAAYNENTDMFESFCKIGTGFTDENLDSMVKRFDTLKSKEVPARVKSEIEPDVWFEPGIVMEVSGAEITESPAHSCARGELGKGLSLRFPRFKQYREKKPEDATSTKEVIEMYSS
jgi:DNA ligase-1